MNNHLLQLTMTVNEFQDMLVHTKHTHSQFEDFKLSLPRYKVGICPFCDREIQARLNTYSLDRWQIIGGFNAYLEDKCDHIVATHCFINLHGITPSEIAIFFNYSEVPYVVPRLLVEPDMSRKVQPKGVMHALPICRVEEGEFVPRYSLFMIVYTALDTAPMHRVYEYFAPGIVNVEPPPDDPHPDDWWNLQFWVDQSRLGWLDANNPSLPVRFYPGAFPYADIKGSTSQIIYKNGRKSEIRPPMRKSDPVVKKSVLEWFQELIQRP